MSTPLENDPQKSPFLHAASPVRKRASSSTSPSPSPSPSSSPSTSPSSSPSPSPSRPLFLRGLLAGLLVVVLALGVWFFLKPAAPVPEKDDAPVVKRSRSVVTPAVTNALPKPRPVATNAASSVSSTNRAVRMEHGLEVIACTAKTNAIGTIVERLTLADGSTLKKVHPPKPLFDNASDDLIATVLSVKPGESMPPLPDLSSIDKDFAQSLLEPIRIEETDSEKTKELKLAVKEARAYIAAELKNGRTVAECLMAHREEMERIADRRLMAVREIQKMKADGYSAEEVTAFRQRVNEIFKEKGMPALPESTDQQGRRGNRK